MRTVAYKSILAGVLRSVGQDPATASTERLAQCGEFIADRFTDAFEYYRWPHYLITEQRFFRDTWTASAFSTGDEVYYAAGDGYYVANATTTGADVPGTSPLWDELSDYHKYVPYEQLGKTAIGAVLGCHSKDPRVFSTALRVGFSIGPLGVTVPPSTALTSIWLTYRTRNVSFAWDFIWSATATYAPDDVIYYAATGEVYTVGIATTAGEDPEDTPAKFTLVAFPHFLARAVKAGARADLLGAMGQEEKEAAREAEFRDLLEEQVFQITKIQGQTGTPTIIIQP